MRIAASKESMVSLLILVWLEIANVKFVLFGSVSSSSKLVKQVLNHEFKL